MMTPLPADYASSDISAAPTSTIMFNLFSIGHIQYLPISIAVFGHVLQAFCQDILEKIYNRARGMK